MHTMTPTGSVSVPSVSHRFAVRHLRWRRGLGRPAYPSLTRCLLVQVGLHFTCCHVQAWSLLGSAHPIAWSRSGGGFSWQFPSPAHQREAVSSYLNQTALLPPLSSFNASNRAYPDVSGISEDGTSQSSPLVAGVFSMVVRLNSERPCRSICLANLIWSCSAMTWITLPLY